MRNLRSLGLAAVITFSAVDAASAGPMSVAPVTPLAASDSASNIESVRLVCGPFRCFRRPGWRYGYGYGFRPFGYGYRGYGYRRYGWRRW